jgi:hypothetical protein
MSYSKLNVFSLERDYFPENCYLSLVDALAVFDDSPETLDYSSLFDLSKALDYSPFWGLLRWAFELRHLNLPLLRLVAALEGLLRWAFESWHLNLPLFRLVALECRLT